jgi:hypothetical protein
MFPSPLSSGPAFPASNLTGGAAPGAASLLFTLSSSARRQGLEPPTASIARQPSPRERRNAGWQRCYEVTDRMTTRFGTWPFRKAVVEVPCSDQAASGTPAKPQNGAEFSAQPDASASSGRARTASLPDGLCEETRMVTQGVGLTGVFRKQTVLVPCDPAPGRGRRSADEGGAAGEADDAGSDFGTEAGSDFGSEIFGDHDSTPGTPADDPSKSRLRTRRQSDPGPCYQIIDSPPGDPQRVVKGRVQPKVVMVPCGPWVPKPPAMCEAVSVHGFGQGMLGHYKVHRRGPEPCDTIEVKPNEKLCKIS